MHNWTSATDLVGQVEKLWNRGTILRAQLQAEEPVAFTLRLRRPTTNDLSLRFGEVQEWIRGLELASKPTAGHGFELIWREVKNRHIGRNRFPVGATIPSVLDASRLIGRVADVEAFERALSETRETVPALVEWFGRHPLTVVEYHREWRRILSVVLWLRANPASGRYLRQIDLPGVDTKFVESHKDLLAQLTEFLGGEAPAGAKSFEARWGLRTKPKTARLRILDPRLKIGSLSDISAPLEELAELALDVTRVFVVENEINGLAFPEVERSIVLFGLGYGAEILASIPWMQRCSIHYWGDIDTHGFAILDRMRSIFPHAESFLMDRETLLGHREWWILEEQQSTRVLERLTPSEKALFDDLRHGRYGPGVRLEQERVRYGRIAAVLNALVTSANVPPVGEA